MIWAYMTINMALFYLCGGEVYFLTDIHNKHSQIDVYMFEWTEPVICSHGKCIFTQISVTLLVSVTCYIHFKIGNLAYKQNDVEWNVFC